MYTNSISLSYFTNVGFALPLTELGVSVKVCLSITQKDI